MCKVFVVILNWNGWKDTLECLASLLPVISDETGIIICDNASSDNSVAHIESWFSHTCPNAALAKTTAADVLQGETPKQQRFYIIENGANLGFAGGNNPGIRLALQHNACNYVWLLNNDTTVNTNSLSAACAYMESDPSIGICGSTLVYFHEKNMVQAFGGATYNKWTGRSKHIGAFAKIEQVPSLPGPVESQMSYVVGAAMLVSRAFIETVGYMREDYFLYGEENDWATRGRKHFRLGYAPASWVWHKEGASIGTSASGGSAISIFYLFRNRVRYAARYTPLFLPSVLLACGWDLAKLVVKRRWPQAVAALRGLVQGKPPMPVKK